MLKYTLWGGFILSVLVLITYSVLSFKKKDRAGKWLGLASIAGIGVIGAYSMSFFLTGQMLKEFACAISMMSMVWQILLVMLYVCEYTGYVIGRFKYILFVIYLIDSALLLTNVINHYVGTYECVYVTDVSLLTFSPGVLYYIHSLVCYIPIFWIFVMLIVKSLRCSVYYRFKYLIEIFVVTLMVIVNLLCVFVLKSPIDFSTFFTAPLFFLLYHCTYTFAPNALRDRIQAAIDESVADATVIYDGDGNLLKINKVAENILEGFSYKSLEALREELEIPDKLLTRKRIRHNIFEIKVQNIEDRNHMVAATICVFHDITESERVLEREHRIATTDTLTGVPNRRGFFEEAIGFLNDHGEEACYAMMVGGIVDFKTINSLYGTKVGDNLLKDIANKLRGFRPNYPMMFGRTAEGKFSILTPFDYVEEIAAEMSLIPLRTETDNIVHAEFKYGFAVMDDDDKPLEYYYERALLALAQIKKEAGGYILEYDNTMEDKAARRQHMFAEMHNALRDEQFYIELQPQISLVTGEVVGAEALVRWNHPTLGRISPGEFVPLFEENGFISNLDIFVWEKAARTLAKLINDGTYDGSISVNVSQIDIRNTDVVGVFERILHEYAIPPEKLHIEITESACAGNRGRLIYIMDELRRRGFKLEIDDFGSGYSSLNALMHLPFDTIKLDMEFMREEIISDKGRTILSSMTKMIHALGADIIAEGVETEKNLENAAFFCADIIQGYYYSRPISVRDFVEFANSRKKR